MKFTFTEEAIQALEKRNATENLSLFYYTDASDCGCPSSGIFVLRVDDTEEKEYDTQIETNLGMMQAQKWALVYLDADNKLDFNSSLGTFVLKSERGYINMNVLVEKKATMQA